MPNYIVLQRKADGAKVDPVDLDSEICEAFDWQVNEYRYARGWYDSILGRLASGQTWDDVRAALRRLEASAECSDDTVRQELSRPACPPVTTEALGWCLEGLHREAPGTAEPRSKIVP